MNIAIIGAGAVGAMIAYRLHQMGLDVTLVAKPHQEKEIKKNGLVVVEKGQHNTVSLPCCSTLSKKPTLIIFTVKTQDVVYAYRDFIDMVSFDTHVLLLQNGVQAENMLSTHINPQHIYGGIVLFWTEMQEPNRLLIHQSGGLVLGRAFYANNPLVHQMAELFGGAFDVVLSDNIMHAKWLKLLVNMCNIPSALINQPLQQAYQYDEICILNYRLIVEAVSILERAGITLEDFSYIKVDRFLEPYRLSEQEAVPMIKERFVKRDGALLGSMLQSLRAQKPSEIDFITGEIVHLARGVESRAPINTAVTNAVHDIERSQHFFGIPELSQLYLP